jgi:hypothetical protein
MARTPLNSPLQKALRELLRAERRLRTSQQLRVISEYAAILHDVPSRFFLR